MAGGRIYDSLPGHGYIVDVQTGNIKGWGMKKKKNIQCEAMLKNATKSSLVFAMLTTKEVLEGWR